MQKCFNCGSKKVFRLRIDSDWGYGVGTYEPVNEKDNYTEDEWNYDACDRPDIELFHCLDCDVLW